MAVFHFHFPDPPPELRFDAAPVDGDHPGAAALREYWQTHRGDAPAVKPTVDVVANVRRAGNAHRARQDREFNDKTLLAWQLIQHDGLTKAAACAEVGIAVNTYTRRARRLELDTSPME